MCGHGQERPPAPARARASRTCFDDYGPGQHLWPYWNRGPGGDAAGDHGALPPGLEAAGARHLHGGRAALLGVRVEREHQAPGAGVQPARRRRPARLHAVGQRQRNGHDAAPLYRAWPRLPGRSTRGRGAQQGTRTANARGRLRIAVRLGPGQRGRSSSRAGAHTRVFKTRVTIRPSARRLRDRSPLRAQLAHPVDVRLRGRLALHARDPRTAPAASRSAAPTGRRRSRAGRARRRRAGRGGRGSSRAGPASRSRAGSAAAACPTSFTQRSITSASLSAVRMSKPLASRWQESRQTPMPLVAAGQVDQVAQLREGAPERVAGARRCSPAAAGTSRTRRAPARNILPTRSSASSCGSPTVEPGWMTTPSAPISSPIRSAWIERVGRLAAHLAVLGGRVDQVDGVDRDRLDRPVLHQLEELRDVVRLPAGRAPHARRLVEDLDRVAAALDAAPMGLHEAAGRRDVGAD